MGAAYYPYRHVVGFEETNLVGNVYYVNFLRWQGRCREMFLQERAPSILDDLKNGLALATVRCACDYFLELEAFDVVEVRMRLGHTRQNRVLMLFEYWRVKDGREELAARGEQEVACMRREGDRTLPTPIPAALLAALEEYR
ncbi:MAG TPA: acyl-CoA thioesterase [Thermoanaerobaculia bacterium]|nr:acyl-CoA thioesterase [Thermoanaerobaculia bacterium]